MIDDVNLHLQGQEQFSRAHSKAFWSDIIAHLLGKSTELWSFDDVKGRLRLNQEVYKGLEDVPLDRIVGSVGRYHDFTNKFLPKKHNMSDRWGRIYALYNGLEGLPPVELYKVDDVYFVRDGNHRVSVARQLGFKFIQAYVIELQTPIDLEPNMSSKQWESAEAYAKFLDDTGLDATRPKQERIVLTEPSRYQDLLEHIHLYQTVLEYQNEGDPLSMNEVSTRWYDTIYAPAVYLIRKYNILKYTPKRTEADLFLWIVENLRYIAEEQGVAPEAMKLSEILTSFLEKQHIPVPDALRHEEDSPVVDNNTD
ncbi:MAG: hypothetical protein RLP44_03075 [Aggregatilineales bacterium]